MRWLLVLPYFISGFSAPFIFKHASSPQIGGHYAGALFIFAGLWSLFLAQKFQMPLFMKIVFVSVLILQIIFWGWRLISSAPLRESALFGLSGSIWHGVMTLLYVTIALILLSFSFYSPKNS